jgi:tetratricopeptide (TPR) repeat protein
MEKKTYKAMLSSTYKELTDHRKAVAEAMIGQQFLPLGMEFDSALPDQDLIDASLAKVNEADAYIGMISYRYGQMPKSAERNPDKLSLTELEFRRALARGIPICMFIMHDEHSVPREAVNKERGAKKKLQAFVRLAQTNRIYAEFRSVDDLKAKVVQSLISLREALDKRAAAVSSSLESTPERPPPRRERGAPTDKPPPTLSNIPITVPQHFLGRDEALTAIHAALGRADGRAAITALHGLRGVGKTTLAVAYAERHHGDYGATWWIRAQTDSSMRADLTALAVRLGWAAEDEKEEPALTALMERLRHEGDGILLIFDNAIDADSIRPYLPRGGRARVLVTSNFHAWHGIAAPVKIRQWPKAIGADFLMARTGRVARVGERAAAEALSETLGGLPLAHEQVGAYCERLGVSFVEYGRRFEAAPVPLLDDKRHTPREYNDGLTVAKSFALAIDEAAKLHSAAEPLIVHAALLAPEPIPLFLFADAREKFGEPLASELAGEGLDEAVAALRAFALVDRETITDERDPAVMTDTIRLHRLVHEVAAARWTDSAREEVRRALVMAMDAVYPRGVGGEPSTWPRARWLDAQALELVGCDKKPPVSAEQYVSSLAFRLATYRRRVLATYAAARPLLELALAIDEKVLGSKHSKTAASLNELGNLLRDQGDYAGALPLCKRALAIREKVLGPQHPDTAASLKDLAQLLRDQGDHAGALPLCKRALAIREKVLGPQHPDTATSLNELAGLLRAQGDLVGARPLYDRALAIYETALGPEHPYTATSLNNLGALLRAQGDLAGARPLYDRALAIREKVLGPEHPDTAQSLNNLGFLLKMQGDFARARPLCERALEIYEKALGPEHPRTVTVRNNLAELQGG